MESEDTGLDVSKEVGCVTTWSENEWFLSRPKERPGKDWQCEIQHTHTLDDTKAQAGTHWVGVIDVRGSGPTGLGVLGLCVCVGGWVTWCQSAAECVTVCLSE